MLAKKEKEKIEAAYIDRTPVSRDLKEPAGRQQGRGEHKPKSTSSSFSN